MSKFLIDQIVPLVGERNEATAVEPDGCAFSIETRIK
jgi:hypothetical protein